MSRIEDFSVILPVYHKDSVRYLEEALKSVVDQSRKSSEIILIEDGPLGSDLRSFIDQKEKEFPELKTLKIATSRGLPNALNQGLEVCSNEWVARMDADDICSLDRFEKQLEFLEKNEDIDVLSSYIGEYDLELSTFFGRREVPTTHEEIMKYAKWRSPFNHMAIVYKKSVVKGVGGYNSTLFSGQDYELWSRILMAGHKGANIPEVLIKARAGQDFYGRRRRGFKHLKNEWRLIGELRKNGLINLRQMWSHRLLKSLVRLAPSVLVKGLYKRLRTTS